MTKKGDESEVSVADTGTESATDGDNEMQERPQGCDYSEADKRR